MSDRAPLEFEGRFLWHPVPPGGSLMDQEDYLPAETFRRLNRHQMRANPQAHKRVKSYLTRDDAIAALERATAKYAGPDSLPWEWGGRCDIATTFDAEGCIYPPAAGPGEYQYGGPIAVVSISGDTNGEWAGEFLVHAANCHVELLTAAERFLSGMDARIKYASEIGLPVPVFDGIAELHAAVTKAAGGFQNGPASEESVPCDAIGPHHGDRCNGGRVEAPNAQFTQDCGVCKGTGRRRRKPITDADCSAAIIAAANELIGSGYCSTNGLITRDALQYRIVGIFAKHLMGDR